MDQPTPGAANYLFAHIYGDINDNGSVEVCDSSLVLQNIVGLYEGEWLTWQIIVADVYLSNEIDAYDVAIILRYVTGMIDELPLRNILLLKNRNQNNISQMSRRTKFLISYTPVHYCRY